MTGEEKRKTVKIMEPKDGPYGMMGTVHYVKVELACILKLDKWNSTRYGKKGTNTGSKKRRDR